VEVGDAPDVDEDEDAAPDLDARLNQEALQYVNVSDILREVADLLTDEGLSSPLVQQLQRWLEDPMTFADPHRPLLAPIQAEHIGRHVAGLAVAAMAHHLQAARARLSNVPF
jgi:hypothetical protein